MYFKLSQFAKNEIKKYQVTRYEEYDINDDKAKKSSFFLDMLIYKKSLKVVTSDINSGLLIQNQLNGKVLKKYDLRLGDIIEVENLKYRVTEILPRLYADFFEFTLEMIRDEQSWIRKNNIK